MISDYENQRILTEYGSIVINKFNQTSELIEKIVKIKDSKNDKNNLEGLNKILLLINNKSKELSILLQQNLKSDDEINALKNNLLQNIADVISDDSWKTSSLLLELKKNWENLYAEIHQAFMHTKLGSKEEIVTTKSEDILQNSQKKFDKGFIQVFILLYQYEGNKLVNWEHALRAITKHNINRPTYREEAHIQELIRSKGDLEKYGYAIVNIKEEDILPQEAKKFDVFNREVLILKENAVKPFNIVGFVHANRKCYSFEDNILTYYGDLTQS